MVINIEKLIENIRNFFTGSQESEEQDNLPPIIKRSERLTPANYPELYSEVEKLEQAFKESFPGVPVPEIYIKRDFDFSAGVVTDSFDGKHRVLLGAEAINGSFSSKEIAAMIAHEYAHIGLSHDENAHDTPTEQHRINECQADYRGVILLEKAGIGKEFMLSMLQKFRHEDTIRQPDKEYTHPSWAERIEATENLNEFSVLREHIHFNGQCEHINAPAETPSQPNQQRNALK